MEHYLKNLPGLNVGKQTYFIQPLNNTTVKAFDYLMIYLLHNFAKIHVNIIYNVFVRCQKNDFKTIFDYNIFLIVYDLLDKYIFTP